MANNFLLIWMDVGIDQSKENFQNTLTQLQGIVNGVKHLSEKDECVDFITDTDNMKVSLIVPNNLCPRIVSLIHDLPQRHGIYIFPGTHLEHEPWKKVMGTHTEIKSIGESFKEAEKKCNPDSIATSFVVGDKNDSTENLNRLEPTFMYTQIFKEILLEMDDKQQSIKDMVTDWREHYTSNIFKLNDIDEFERDYSSQSSIWWYTRESFIYEMLNRALRLMEADTIITMGVFIRHLHHQIEELHRQQTHYHYGQPFMVYRGQGLSTSDFEKLLKSKGRLMSFNNFLSTSMNENISRMFAEDSSMQSQTFGILFKMTIDPNASSAPFAFIREVSCFQEEEEILFSMHTVFRVNEITELDDTGSLYQVDLILTADDDPDLRILTEQIRKEIANETGWKRLGLLLIKLNQFDKATELYNTLLEQTADQNEKAFFTTISAELNMTKDILSKRFRFTKKRFKF